MTVDSAGKIQVTFHPALPATCAVCHKSANGDTRFLDFQADLDYYGAIAVCEDCAKEMLSVLDYAPVALVEVRNETIETLEEAYLAVRNQNEQLRNALDSILVVRSDLSDNVDRILGVDAEESESSDRKSSED